MRNASELMWGNRSSTLQGEALWGARAIVVRFVRGLQTSCALDLLWDRQGAVGEDAAREELQKALNAGPLRKFLALAGKARPENDDVVAATINLRKRRDGTCDAVQFDAVARGGYLYITAALLKGRA